MVSQYKMSRFLEFNDLPLLEFGRNEVLIFSSLTNSLFNTNHEIYDKLVNNRISEIPVSDIELLLKYKILIPIEVDEISDVISGNLNHSSHENVSLVLHSSANCQFGCSYCGQNHVKKNINLSIKEKIYSYVDNALKKSSGNLLYIMWHGAEPLMSLSNLREMSKKLIQIANDNGVEYHSKIITNGLSLKPSIFNELYHDLQIKDYQITIDGNKDYHDLRRMTKDNRPTFDIIIENIKGIVNEVGYDSYNYPIEIRINIDATNSDGIFELIDFFAILNFQQKVLLNFFPVSNYSDNKFKSINGHSLEDYSKLELELILYSIKKGFFFGSFLPGRTFQTCMAVNKNATMIDIYGNMYPCYSFPYTQHALEAINKIGNVIQDEQRFNKNPQLRNWYNEILETKNQCYHCNLLPSCGGSCPLKWHEGEVPCPAFKHNIKQRMLLEYLNTNDDILDLLN